jgi:hypothetical protein
MTADEIRARIKVTGTLTGEGALAFALLEIAAQLAELNANICEAYILPRKPFKTEDKKEHS